MRFCAIRTRMLLQLRKSVNCIPQLSISIWASFFNFSTIATKNIYPKLLRVVSIYDMENGAKFFNCQHGENLLLQLNALRLEKQFCDVTLIANGTRINAHKNILSAASPYFLAMFNGFFPESEKKEITMSDIDGECLRQIIDYIYTGSLGVNQANVETLLTTASFLQVDWVEERCCEFLAKALDAGNCLGIKHFAEKQLCGILEGAANDFIIKHFQQVMKSDEFVDISIDEILAILSNDELYMHSEDAILQGINKWVSHKPDERMVFINKLLQYLHPACVTESVVRSIDILQDNENCSEWINRVLDGVGQLQWHIFVLDKMGKKPDLFKYDVTYGSLMHLKPLPDEAFAISLVGHKNLLYVQGGCVGRSRKACFYYNVYRDQWHSMRPLREPRSHHRSLVLDEYLYALGGNGKRGALSSVECLDLETNSAMYIEPMLAQRSSMGAVSLDKCIYVMGGETDNKSLYSMERYDPREGIWHQMPQLNVVNSYCTSAAIDNWIYCCEGLGCSMERYDARATKWEIIRFADEREFYEIFCVDKDLFSICGEEIARYFPDINQWATIYDFPFAREWDTAVGMHVMNYCV